MAGEGLAVSRSKELPCLTVDLDSKIGDGQLEHLTGLYLYFVDRLISWLVSEFLAGVATKSNIVG